MLSSLGAHAASLLWLYFVGPSDIYVTETNESIKDRSPILSNAINIAPILGWSPYGDALIIAAGIVLSRDPITGFIDEKSVKGVTWLYNVAEDNATEIRGEVVIAWGDAPDQLLIYSRDGKLVKKTFHELAAK